ncbi:RCC1/BLIP-II [Clavulina sp. PMI_390]|nr:RCC1/BLIP-II [Clavulina sp. PMI_390]
MPGRPRAGSAAAPTSRSLKASAAALAESLAGTSSAPSSASKKEKAGLGKRKRQISSRSPSPTRSEAGTKRRRRSRSRTPAASSVRASTAGPTTGAAANARILAALKARDDVVLPVSHPRPCRQLFVWGNGDMGQFGLGLDTLGDIPKPQVHSIMQHLATSGGLGLEPGAGLEAIACGGMHSLAIDESGRIWSWGINDNASLGRRTVDVYNPANPDIPLDPEILETAPTVIPTLLDEEFRAVKVAAGDSVSVALGIKGELRVWGSFRSSDGLLGFDGRPGSSNTQIVPIAMPTLQQHEFVDIACGTDHIIVLSKTGFVYAWGNGQQAQLGRKIIERRKTNGLDPERLAIRNIVAIGSGSYHSFAVDRNGHVYAWGLNSLDQTGVDQDAGGSASIVSTPSIVSSLIPSNLNGRRVTAISGGEHHTLFLLSDGSVWGCGRCDGYELGLADDHPALKEVDERRLQAEEKWRRKRAAVLAKREKEEEARVKRRARSMSRAAASAPNSPHRPPSSSTRAGRSSQTHIEDEDLPSTQPADTEDDDERGRSTSIVNRMLTASHSNGSMVSHTPSFHQLPDEWASDKPPPQNEFVSTPVPIPFPPPPSAAELAIDSELANDPPFPAWSDTFYQAPPDDPVVQISAGTRHNLAVTKAGHVYAWGFSPQNALGLGEKEEAAKVPTRVRSESLLGWKVVNASAGGQHCLALALPRA